MDKYSTGGAVAGGVAGAAIGGPAGAMIGAGIGGSLGGMLKPREKYKSPSFADIDLARDNPALFAELQKYEQLGSRLEALYNQRRTGPSAAEQRMKEGALQDQRQNMASRGLLGGSTSMLAEQDLNRRFQEDVMARSAAEQQALMGQLLAQRQNQIGLMSGAQNAIMGNLGQEAMTDYNSRVANDQARNQFFMGLAQGGMGLYGANQQANAMNANTAALAAQRQAYAGVPQAGAYAPPPVLMQQPAYQMPAFGSSSPYYGRGY